MAQSDPPNSQSEPENQDEQSAVSRDKSDLCVTGESVVMDHFDPWLTAIHGSKPAKKVPPTPPSKKSLSLSLSLLEEKKKEKKVGKKERKKEAQNQQWRLFSMEQNQCDLLDTWINLRREYLPALGVEPEVSPRLAGEATAIVQALVHGRYAPSVDELCEILRFACTHRFHGAKVLENIAYFKAHQADITADYRKARCAQAVWQQKPGYGPAETPPDDPSWYED